MESSKLFAIAFALMAVFALSGAAFAQESASTYHTVDGVEMSRAVMTNDSLRISDITGAVNHQYTTVSTLTIKNSDTRTKYNVTIVDPLYQAIGDAQFEFTPAPTSIEDNPVWYYAKISPGQSITITTSISGKVSQDVNYDDAIPDIRFQSLAMLTLPATIEMGKPNTIFVTTPDSQTIPGQDIIIVDPAGNKVTLKSNSSGAVVFVPDKAGRYTLFATGAQLDRPYYFEISTSAGTPPTAASLQGAQGASSKQAGNDIGGIISGIMLVGFVMVLVFAYIISSRRQSPAQPDAGASAPGTGSPNASSGSNDELVIDEGSMFSAKKQAADGESTSVFESSDGASTIGAEAEEASKSIVGDRLKRRGAFSEFGAAAGTGESGSASAQDAGLDDEAGASQSTEAASGGEGEETGPSEETEGGEDLAGDESAEETTSGDGDSGAIDDLSGASEDEKREMIRASIRRSLDRLKAKYAARKQPTSKPAARKPAARAIARAPARKAQAKKQAPAPKAQAKPGASAADAAKRREALRRAVARLAALKKKR